MRVRNQYLVIAAAVWGLCLVLGAGAFAVVLQPKLQYKEDLEGDVARAREEYARAFEAAGREAHARLAEEVERLQDRAADFVVPIERAPDLAFEISELANVMRLDAFAMSPGNDGRRGSALDEGPVREKPIEVSFRATFPQFAAFVNAVERHRPILFVETFAIRRPGERSADAQVSMELTALMETPPGE
jgi:Tfp pilus assembly protein PilO